MPFGSVKIKAKVNNHRGCLDATAIEEACINSWDDIQDTMANVPEDVAAQIKEHFNTMLEDFDDLGDILFGDKSDFENSIGNLTPDQKKQYMEELVKQEILDGQSIEDSMK